MAETSIQKARRLAREKREKGEAEERAAKKRAKKPAPKKEEKGFFSSFFDRAETIDAAVEGRKREAQTTDSNNN